MSKTEKEIPIPEEIQKWIDDNWKGSSGGIIRSEGAASMYRHLMADRPKGVRWVKCSDRMPKDIHNNIWRPINTKSAHNGTLEIQSGKLVGPFGWQSSLDGVEWLEEAEQPEAPAEKHNDNFWCAQRDWQDRLTPCHYQCEKCKAEAPAEPVPVKQDLDDEVEQYRFQEGELTSIYHAFQKQFRDDEYLPAYPFFKEGYRLTREEISTLHAQIEELKIERDEALRLEQKAKDILIVANNNTKRRDEKIKIIQQEREKYRNALEDIMKQAPGIEDNGLDLSETKEALSLYPKDKTEEKP